MPFEDTFCDRDGCHHNVPDHHNDGSCIKCRCVGFFAKSVHRDSISEHYLKKIVDTHIAFTSELDTAKHLVQDFPTMAEWFFQQKDKKQKNFGRRYLKKIIP